MKANADVGKGTTGWQFVFKVAGPGIPYCILEYDNDPDVLISADIAYRYRRCER